MLYSRKQSKKALLATASAIAFGIAASSLTHHLQQQEPPQQIMLLFVGVMLA